MSREKAVGKDLKKPQRETGKPVAAPDSAKAEAGDRELGDDELREVSGGTDNPGESISLNFTKIHQN